MLEIKSVCWCSTLLQVRLVPTKTSHAQTCLTLLPTTADTPHYRQHVYLKSTTDHTGPTLLLFLLRMTQSAHLLAAVVVVLACASVASTPVAACLGNIAPAWAQYNDRQRLRLVSVLTCVLMLPALPAKHPQPLRPTPTCKSLFHCRPAPHNSTSPPARPAGAHPQHQ